MTLDTAPMHDSTRGKDSPSSEKILSVLFQNWLRPHLIQHENEIIFIQSSKNNLMST